LEEIDKLSYYFYFTTFLVFLLAQYSTKAKSILGANKKKKIQVYPSPWGTTIPFLNATGSTFSVK
jgi:hypothetical protein